MNDHGLLPEHEIVGVLRDAAATHENAVGTETETERPRAVADLINAIIAGDNLASSFNNGREHVWMCIDGKQKDIL
ncbi:hypothetical protein [Roseovarius sp. MBR-154]|jgi:hypothetical protein